MSAGNESTRAPTYREASRLRVGATFVAFLASSTLIEGESLGETIPMRSLR